MCPPLVNGVSAVAAGDRAVLEAGAGRGRLLEAGAGRGGHWAAFW